MCAILTEIVKKMVDVYVSYLLIKRQQLFKLKLLPMKLRKIRIKYKLLIFVIDEGVGNDNVLPITHKSYRFRRLYRIDRLTTVKIQKTEFVTKSSL